MSDIGRVSSTFVKRRAYARPMSLR
ncbi:hypothetical protein MexAM1_META1p3309 [Methylorubrum extorquens AM1]|uniref:Uncharacterized protein n=1 Tax=Methylorubrum extorquens (strain ATCC 14718 / DSM 1338 / JCM 2805 / NCIMB 9133 / AM1) TaxID=272630 RepID=C5AXI1_METEA|nr:hypothetical protein MexAM1_META1p3309 [Methylorubrum extorquens AM1]